MTHTTTDAAEARALHVIQADRDAAGSLVPLCFGASELWQSNVRAGYYDDGEIVQAFARHRLATAEAASGAGKREDPDHQYAVTSSDYSRPFLAGAYRTLEAAKRAQCGQPDKWHIYQRLPLASLPPATGPVMAAPADWVNSIAGVKPTDQFIALDRRLFEDCIARALAAAPTIPATGEADDDCPCGIGDQSDIGHFHESWCPATGHAATEGEG